MKNTNFVVGGDFGAGRREGDQVRGTKYEVKELGATELRRGRWKEQSWNNAWEPNPCTRVDAPLVRKAFVTRIGISIAAFFENFLGTGEGTKYEEAEPESGGRGRWWWCAGIRCVVGA